MDIYHPFSFVCRATRVPVYAPRGQCRLFSSKKRNAEKIRQEQRYPESRLASPPWPGISPPLTLAYAGLKVGLWVYGYGILQSRYDGYRCTDNNRLNIRLYCGIINTHRTNPVHARYMYLACIILPLSTCTLQILFSYRRTKNNRKNL